MHNGKVKLVIGFITYGKSTEKYLPYFLPSLVGATDSHMSAHERIDNIKIIAFDNSKQADNENIRFIKEKYQEIEIMREGKNIGFSRAYNKIIKRAKDYNAKYFLVINPDIILENNAIDKMVNDLDNDHSLGSVSPKILKWGFHNNQKTNIIDTCGIVLKSGLKFINFGQGRKEENLDNINILGPSGAAAMYRMSALEKIKEGDNYFDESMFMYKEDCDLAYRLKLASYKSKSVKDAIIYHDRSASSKGDSDIEIAVNRKNKSRNIKIWSFLGQQLILYKYWRLQTAKNKLAIIWQQIKTLIFILLFEQFLLLELPKLYRIRKKVKIYK